MHATFLFTYFYFQDCFFLLAFYLFAVRFSLLSVDKQECEVDVELPSSSPSPPGCRRTGRVAKGAWLYSSCPFLRPPLLSHAPASYFTLSIGRRLKYSALGPISGHGWRLPYNEEGSSQGPPPTSLPVSPIFYLSELFFYFSSRKNGIKSTVFFLVFYFFYVFCQ